MLDISSWSGSGFAIGRKHIATNHHVVKGATNLYIYIPSLKRSFKAETAAADAVHDLAIVKITDAGFTGFNKIDYGFKIAEEYVGTDIFTLGYPLIHAMGLDVKLTTGVISSQSGYQGDRSLYQISSAVQPGNSGGPLFNKAGDVVGIIVSSLNNAENVNYAIKMKYLYNLSKKLGNAINFNTPNKIRSLSLSGKVKAVSPCVVLVMADNKINGPSSRPKAPHYYDKPQVPASKGIIPEPKVSSINSRYLKVRAIELTPEHTRIYLSFTNTQYKNGLFNINKNTYITDARSTRRYVLNRTYNCAIAPNSTRIPYGSTLYFVLEFPPVPAGVSLIDMCEPGSNAWMIHGIKVK